MTNQQRPADVVTLASQKLLIITGSDDNKATPWNEKCVPVWEKAGGKVVRSGELLDPTLIFPTGNQHALTDQINGYLRQNGNIPPFYFPAPSDCQDVFVKPQKNGEVTGIVGMTGHLSPAPAPSAPSPDTTHRAESTILTPPQSH